jgi:hypothetical protein
MVCDAPDAAMAIDAITTIVACQCHCVRLLRNMGSSRVCCWISAASEVPRAKRMKMLVIAAEVAATGP